MIALALAAAGLSALLVMLVARVFPARRAAEILGFVGAILAFTCSQSGNLYNSFGHSANVSGAQVSNMFTLLMRFNTPWLPLNWAGQGLVALGEGRWLTGLLLVALTLGLSALAFMFALATAERWYYSGWAGMQVVARRKKPLRDCSPAATVGEATRPGTDVAGIACLGIGTSAPRPGAGHHLEGFPAAPPRPAQPVTVDLPAHLRGHLFVHVLPHWRSAACRAGQAPGLVHEFLPHPADLWQCRHVAVRRLEAAGAAFRDGFFIRRQELLDVESSPAARRLIC